LVFDVFVCSGNLILFSIFMALQFSPTVTRDKRSLSHTAPNPSLTTPHGQKQRKQTPLTMEEWKELYEWHIYILYRRAVDY
jgi:hypothetical protein